MLRTLDSTYLLLQASAEPLQASKYKCPFNSVLRGQDRPATQAPVPRHTGGTPPLPNLVHLPTAGETLLFQEAAFTGCSSSNPVGKDRILPSYGFVRKKKIFFELPKPLPKGKYKGAQPPEKVASPRRTERF